MYIRPVEIGSVKIKNNIFLAPMAGVTDLPFRLLCREQGCGLTYTEMASSKAVHYNSEKTKGITAVGLDEKPCAVQIFGSDPDIMGETAAKISSEGADMIDINMGCPTPKIVKNGEGAALMQHPELVEKIVRAVVQASRVPVTVKMRKGWDGKHVNAVEIALIAQENSAAAVAVHGRTRDQFYSGKADWDIILKVKQAVGIPVIGNGDVFSPEDAKAMFDYTGCDMVMIGRGAQGNPWIFSRVLTYLETGRLLAEPTYEARIGMILRHLEMMIEYKGEYAGVREMRKHISWYLKGMKNAARVRDEVNRMEKGDDIKGYMERYMKGCL